MLCLRAFNHEDPASKLLSDAEGIRFAKMPSDAFLANAEDFRRIPNTPFAYWVPKKLSRVFLSHSAFENVHRRVRQGGVIGNDTKYLRAWWEVGLKDMAPGNIQWMPFAKGGKFSSFYADIPMVVRWDFKRSTFFSYTGLPHRPSEKPSSADSYFSPGLTWPLRAHRFSPVPLPRNSIFSIRGYAILADNEEELLPLLAIGNSTVFDFIYKLALGRFGYPEFVVGVLQKLPLPFLDKLLADRLADGAFKAWKARREIDTASAISHAFSLPALLVAEGETLGERAASWAAKLSTKEIEIAESQSEIDELALGLFGLAPVDAEMFSHSLAQSDDGDTDMDSSDGEEEDVSSAGGPAVTADLLSYILGVAVGRWDIRYATGEKTTQEFHDPFAPLPICPPGQLQNEHGLPALPGDVSASYPVRIPWDGILVDDPNHPLDLVPRMREAIDIIWSGKSGGPTGEAIENQACEILGVQSLRDYLSKPACFFADHLKRHSKSRRQAPIYWQLSAGSGSYSAWLYYHRFTQDTLYRALRDLIEPRIQLAEREQFELESQGALSADAATRLQEAQTLLQDLRIFKSELDLVAPLWNPNLNDGVIINHAILWRITPYTPWQKKCKECWDKLVKGDYDWAHLAFHLWPDRVIPKCTTDRSLAIAHGLEERLWQQTNNSNWLPRQLSEADLQALIAEHSNPAVKSALERFLAAPPPVAPTRTRASRSTRSSGSSTPRRARGSAAVVDAEATRQVLLALTAAPSDGLAKTQIADLIGVEANALTAVIKQLKESGQIDQLGERRGARYVLNEQGRARLKQEEES